MPAPRARPSAPRLLAAACLGAALLAGCGQPDAGALMAQASRDLERQDTRAALVALKAALQQSPDHGAARVLLARALLAQGDAAGADVELQRARQSGAAPALVAPVQAAVALALNRPQAVVDELGAVQLAEPAAQADLRAAVARAHWQLGRTDAARHEAQAALQAQPGHTDAQLLLLRLQAAGGDVAGALAAARPLATQAAPAWRGPAWLLVGDLLQATRGTAADVEAAYAQALQAAPDLMPAHAAVVAWRLQQGDVDGARRQAQAAVDRAPANAQAVLLQALVALTAGEAGRARELGQTLLKSLPRHPRVLLLAGQAEAAAGSPLLAESLLARAVAADPDATPPRLAWADLLVQRGQAAQALQALAPVLQQPAPPAQALTLAARAQLLRGDARAADTAFAAALKQAPDNTALRTARAIGQWGRTSDDRVLAELGDLARQDKGPQADLALVAAHLSRGQLGPAQAAADALAAKLPQHPLPELLRGRIAAQRGDLPAATRHVEQALSRDPRHLQALAELALLDERAGRPARARFEAHLQQQPDHAAAMLALADHLLQRGQRADALPWLQKAVTASRDDAATTAGVVDRLLRLGDTAAALDLAQAAQTRQPGDADLLDTLARAQLRAGRHDAAITTLTQLAARRPGADVHLRLGQVHDAAGRPAAADAQVRLALEKAPQSAAVRRAAVLLAARQRQPARAYALARELQALQPGEALGHRLEGDAAAELRDGPAAVAAYRRALDKANPGDTALVLHATLLATGQAAEADRFASGWLKAHPDDDGLRLQLADLQLQRGGLGAAEAGYRQVLARQPQQPHALNNLALVLMKQGKAGALPLARQAVEQEPARAELHDTLASALAADGQVDAAIRSQLAAVQLAPKAPALHLGLIRLYLQAGDKARARAALDDMTARGLVFGREDEVRSLRQRIAA